MTSFGRTSEMLDGCELFAFDDGAIRNSDEIQTEFRAEIRNRNSKFTMLTRIIMYRERKRCRTRDALTGPAKSDGESVEVGDPSPKTSERTLMNFSQTLMNFSRITQTESEKLRKFRTVSNGALSERSKWRRTGFAFDDVRARSSDTRNEHKQPTQVTSEERMNLKLHRLLRDLQSDGAFALLSALHAEAALCTACAFVCVSFGPWGGRCCSVRLKRSTHTHSWLCIVQCTAWTAWWKLFVRFVCAAHISAYSANKTQLRQRCPSGSPVPSSALR